MDFGLFIEFPCREGMTEREAFAECFALVDAAETLGVNSVWLAEYHFSPISVLSSPITIASAIAARTQRVRMGLAVPEPCGVPMAVRINDGCAPTKPAMVTLLEIRIYPNVSLIEGHMLSSLRTWPCTRFSPRS